MRAAVYQVCYPFCRKRGRHRAVKRREFMALIGGAAAAWPLAVRAQQALPAIGFLHEGLPAPLSLTTAFQQGLIEAGISAGSSLRIENRWAEGQYDRLPALAVDLIEHRVGIIVALYLVAAQAAKATTQTVPVVFITGSDPILAGLVPSLSRPMSRTYLKIAGRSRSNLRLRPALAGRSQKLWRCSAHSPPGLSITSFSARSLPRSV